MDNVNVNNANYNWNAPLLPGTVVCAAYGDFDNTRRVGIFVVLYDEQLDNNVFAKKNVIAVKISSQSTLVSNYSVPVNAEHNDFLDKSCIVCTSKIHVLHKESNIYKVLGRLDVNARKNIFKSYFKFISETQRQLVDTI